MSDKRPSATDTLSEAQFMSKISSMVVNAQMDISSDSKGLHITQLVMSDMTWYWNIFRVIRISLSRNVALSANLVSHSCKHECHEKHRN